MTQMDDVRAMEESLLGLRERYAAHLGKPPMFQNAETGETGTYPDWDAYIQSTLNDIDARLAELRRMTR